MKMANVELFRKALLIRRVEETLLELFSLGKLNGTVHTCVGQEFSALAFAGQLGADDFIFSGHRCHGHFIARSGDWRALLAELMGKRSGVCAGIGGSQHLCHQDFFSNGIQGGIMPVAAGLALSRKKRRPGEIGVVFIGDGTLGEGVVYETLNIVAKWQIPLLIVCEDNGYAQSTSSELTLAGEVRQRAEAFGIRTAQSDTWQPQRLIQQARDSIDCVRRSGSPLFHHVKTYRLKGHSKGDDTRPQEEVDSYLQKDPLYCFSQKEPEAYDSFLTEIDNEINQALADLEKEPPLALDEYYKGPSSMAHIRWTPLKGFSRRQVEAINQYFKEALKEDANKIFMGEDVLMPYGGAFKVAGGLSDAYPEQVVTTPVSEAAMVGIANGLALGGMRPYLEIMFGDFMMLCMDQLVNQASKFYHIYNRQVRCPVVVRTPMGARRGYGPTHSQTLDKFLIGMDNVTTLALNILIDPIEVYRAVEAEEHPVVVIENKTDYEKKGWQGPLLNMVCERSSHRYPVVRISPAQSEPTVTLVTHGGMTSIVLDALEDIFARLDLKPQVFVLTQISPLDCTVIADSVHRTGKLFVIEEGSAVGGIGSEVIAGVAESCRLPFIAKRIASLPVPVPAAKELEDEVLVTKDTIIRTIQETCT